MEGMMGDPLSAHRYIYGHNNPIQYLDPSGKSKLEDLAVTCVIISNLAAVGLEAYAIWNEDFGDWLASKLPDAGLIGLSFSGSVRIAGGLNWLLDKIAPLQGLVDPTLLNDFAFLDMEYGASVGAEFLCSISSAQFGFYVFGGLHGGFTGSMGPPGPLDGAVTVSHGWVWNLWNTDDYVGPFWSVNIGLGPLGGISLFKDAKRSFDKGPFGMTFPAGVWPPSKSISINLAHTWYPRKIPVIGLKSYGYINAGSEWEVAVVFMQSELAMACLSGLSENPIGVVTSLAGVSWPMTIAASKEIWNRRRTNPEDPEKDYSIAARQFPESKRPKGFSSGPKRWIFWGG